MTWRVFLDQQNYRGTGRLFIRHDPHPTNAERNPKTAFVTFTDNPVDEMQPGQPAIDSSFGDRDAEAFLQAAMDCAWEAGLRPAGYKAEADGLRGQLSATQDHLHDMRALVYAGDMKPEEKTPPPLPSTGSPRR